MSINGSMENPTQEPIEDCTQAPIPITTQAPAPASLEDRFDSNYRYVLVAARRARQLQNGSAPLVATHSTKACRVAQDEIAAGVVKYVRLSREGSSASERAGALVNTYSYYR